MQYIRTETHIRCITYTVSISNTFESHRHRFGAFTRIAFQYFTNNLIFTRVYFATSLLVPLWNTQRQRLRFILAYDAVCCWCYFCCMLALLSVLRTTRVTHSMTSAFSVGHICRSFWATKYVCNGVRTIARTTFTYDLSQAEQHVSYESLILCEQQIYLHEYTHTDTTDTLSNGLLYTNKEAAAKNDAALNVLGRTRCARSLASFAKKDTARLNNICQHIFVCTSLCVLDKCGFSRKPKKNS